MQRAIVTLESLVHSKFVSVTAMEPGTDREHPCYHLRAMATADDEVEDITICISKRRAEQAGLIRH